MAQPGKISVELALELNKLREQARQAANVVKQAFGKPIEADAGKAVTNEKNLSKATEETTKSIRRKSAALNEVKKAAMDAWQAEKKIREANISVTGIGGVPAKQGGLDFGTSANPGRNIKEQAVPTGSGGGAGFYRDEQGRLISRGGIKPGDWGINLPPAGKTLPFVPKVPKMESPIQPNMIKAMLPSIAAGIGTVIGGPLGGALAGVLTKANPAVAATTAAMTALRMSVQQVAEAMARAHALYIQAIRSGYGVNTQVQRSTLANVIGVGQDEIFQFGGAIAQFNDKLKVTMGTLRETTPVLAYTSMNWKVMMENFRAVWARIAETIAPAINQIEDLMSAILRLVQLGVEIKITGLAIRVIIEAITRFTAGLLLIPAALNVVTIAFMDMVKNLVAGIHNYIAGTRLGRMAGMEKEKTPGFGDTKEAMKAFGDIFKVAFGQTQATKSNMPPYMKQMPVSAWERMGLQIGAGGGTNYPQQTAQNTRRTNELTQKVLDSIQANKFKSPTPAGMPSAA